MFSALNEIHPPGRPRAMPALTKGKMNGALTPTRTVTALRSWAEPGPKINHGYPWGQRTRQPASDTVRARRVQLEFKFKPDS